MFSGCFAALKSQIIETSPNKDALVKNVPLKVNSLQSFKKKGLIINKMIFKK